MTLTMYDSPYNSQFPAGGDAYAAYVDGHVGDQPNYAYVVHAFPAAHHLSIAVFASDDADCLDVEKFAASPEDVAAWYARQKARGVARPGIYASVSTMEAGIVPVIQALPGVARSEVRLWSAHYGAGDHICGPSTCRLVSIGMDGTQWADTAGGLTADQSLLLDDFFGIIPQWTEFDMAKLRVLRQGDKDVAGGGFFWVIRLQDDLRRTGLLNGITAAENLKSDGDFGPLTTTAVKAIQAHYGLAEDGVCGKATWGALLTGSPG